MNVKLACLSLLFLSACTEQVEVDRISASDDLSGLQDSEKREFDYGALEIVIPSKTARLLKRWQLSNVSLLLSRCDEPDDYYPADARMEGTYFDPENLERPSAGPVKLTFYLPKHVQDRSHFNCATFDARGYSPVFLKSKMMQMPAIHFERSRGAAGVKQPAS